ncbi:hypothetical protein [Agrococcus sp. ARC_14]|uniref:hypothetical protein n=1 Tax=Agrococcus sp. ARC_14 TaxID=2919927 RepID=UPI001F05D4F2|nr:hypothetical protein [Agrococcus sp. ARC_14]MCH1883553.1 hypothetical protein [Agrococcus sp. ARC_14]
MDTGTSASSTSASSTFVSSAPVPGAPVIEPALTRLRGLRRIATALGAVLFALLGSGVLGAVEPGSAAFVAQNTIGLVAGVLLVLGASALGGARPAASSAPDALLRWGIRCATIGFACAAGMHALAILSSGLDGAAAQPLALAGVPLVIASHLLYLGTSLVGAAMLRRRLAPVAVGVLLVASLPILLVGVPLGLALDPGGSGGVVAWIATEAQTGAAWFALAAVAPGSRRAARSG